MKNSNYYTYVKQSDKYNTPLTILVHVHILIHSVYIPLELLSKANTKVVLNLSLQNFYMKGGGVKC